MVQKNCINKKAIIICGATASGKTALAVECAKLLNSEVISADSMYIYKGLSIGTAKPTKDEMKGIVHHLIDVAEPTDSFSVSDYKLLATPILDRLFEENKVPIICGGTGFYINSLLFDLSYGNSKANIDARVKYNNLAKEKGNIAVYNVLIEKDPQTASKLHFNDLKRVIRALEIIESGYKKSEINDSLTPKFSYNAYSISHPREVLYNRINSRVENMIKAGLINEIQSLIDSGVNKNCQCFQGIGYKEVLEYLDGTLSLDETVEKIKLNTRHYAKRQITFFKRMDNLTMLEPQTVELLAKRIVGEL